MRTIYLALPALLLATPACAEPYRAPPVLPPELSDPAMADRLGQALGAMTKALMNLPVGEVEAAVEGRPATPADRKRTVGDTIGGHGVEREVAAKAAQSGRAVQAGAQAMARALPQIIAAMNGVERDVERAMSNIPDPTYPRR